MLNSLSDEIESLCFLVQKNPKVQNGQEVQNGQKEQDDQRIPLWPYVVAVTGHRFSVNPKDLEGMPVYDRETIKNAFRKELEALAKLWKEKCNIESGGDKYKEVNAPLILLTGMADGTDQLAAEVALEEKFRSELNVKVVAVLPMEEELFKLTITDKELFDSLLKQVYLKYELPLLDKSDDYRRKIVEGNKHDADDPSDNQDNDNPREKQYKYLGQFLALHCHVMFTFWDGIDVSKTRPGGTSSALHFKLEGNTDDQSESDMLTYTSVGPVVQFLTPRKNTENLKEPVKGLNVERLEQDKEVAVFYWSKHDLWDQKNKCYFFPDRERMTEENRCKKSVSSMKEIVETLERLGELNWYSINCPEDVKKELSTSKKYLFKEEYFENTQNKPEDFCDAETKALNDHYMYVDQLARWFQDKMKSNVYSFLWGVGCFLLFGALLSSFLEIRQNGWGTTNIFSFIYFRQYTLYEMFLSGKWWTVLNWLMYLYWSAIIVFIVVYFMEKHYWNYRIRFYRFRAVAEALRVQIYWRIAEMSNCVSGHYRTHQLHETEWLRTAINGLDVLLDSPKKENFDKTRKERLIFVRDVWINDQLEYFQTKLIKGKEAHSFYQLKYLGRILRLFKRVEQLLGFKTIVFLFMLFWIILIFAAPIMPPNLNSLHRRGEYWAEIPLIFCGLFLLIFPIYGLIKFWMNAKFPQSDLDRYKQMLFPFDRAILLLKPDLAREDIDELLDAEPETEPETESKPKNKLKKLQTILCQLGTEAVSENASWYLSFGERKLTLPQ